MMEKDESEKLSNLKVMREWVDAIRDLNGDDFKKAFLAFYDFGIDRKEVDINAEKNTAIKIALRCILPNVERVSAAQRDRANVSRNNGRNGGRPRKVLADDDEASVDGGDQNQYTAKRLLELYPNDIKPEFAKWYERVLMYYYEHDKRRLPKDILKGYYDFVVDLAQNDPKKARTVVDYTIILGFPKFYKYNARMDYKLNGGRADPQKND